MKVLLLNSFKKDNLHTAVIERLLLSKLFKEDSIEKISVVDKNIGHCIGCFNCWVKTPGECVIKDDSQELLQKYINCDLVIYLTPIVFGGYSYELKKFLDRAIPLVSPLFTRINKEMHHKRRYEAYPMLMALGLMENEDEECEKNFKDLVFRNSLNMYTPIQEAAVIFSGDNEECIEEKLTLLVSGVRGKN
jgi:multimeric flavodoxin WrbA